MTDKEKFEILWILCSERAKKQYHEMVKKIEMLQKQNKEQRK